MSFITDVQAVADEAVAEAKAELAKLKLAGEKAALAADTKVSADVAAGVARVDNALTVVAQRLQAAIDAAE